MGKARYYGMATREEKQDVSRSDRGARVYGGGPLTYSAVVTAILNYKDTHPNFDNLTTTAAASAIAKELKDTGKYGSVSASGSRIKGEGYSIALTKGGSTGGMIVASKASEQINTDKKKK
jgi:hypothetical protein